MTIVVKRMAIQRPGLMEQNSKMELEHEETTRCVYYMCVTPCVLQNFPSSGTNLIIVLAWNIVTFFCGWKTLPEHEPWNTSALTYRITTLYKGRVSRNTFRGGKDSVEHCAESMWERFETQIGALCGGCP